MFESRFAHLATHFRIPTFLLSLLFIVIAGFGTSEIHFDGSTRFFFGKHHPHLLAYEEVEIEFGRIDGAMLMVSAKEGHLFTAGRLSAIEQLSQDSWEIPYTARVDSLANYQYSYSQNDELIVEALIEDAASYNSEKIEQTRYRALGESALINRLLTRDGKHAAIVITSDLSEGDNRQPEEKEASDAIYALIDQFEQNHPDLDVAVTGTIINNSTVMGSAIRDLSTVVPAMYAVIFVLLAILLRSVLAMLTIAITAIASCISALGLAGWAGITLSPTSLTSITIVITVAVAHCVHVVIYFLQHFRQNGDKKASMIESLRVNLQPMFLTSFTTAIGFLSMNLSEIRPLVDLGNIVSMGVMVAFALSITLLPAALMFLPVARGSAHVGTMSNRIDRFADWVISRRHSLLWSTLLFSLILLALATQNVFNDRFTESTKKPHVFRTDTDLVDKHLGNLYTIEYIVRAKGVDGINDPEYLENLARFTDWLRQQPKVNNAFSYSDVIKRLNKNMHNDDPAWYRIPQSRELAAQYLLLYEISLPSEQDLSNQINGERSATRVTITFPTTDSHDVLTLRNNAINWQKENLPAYMHDDGASYAVMWTFLGKEAIESSLWSAFSALVFISMILMIALRSVRYGLISMIPNLLPAGIGFGFWFLFNGELSMTLLSVLSITIGIVVDDTVHFLSKYQRAIKEKAANSEQAVRYAFRSVGSALWITTIVLIAGFSTLSFSELQPNSHMGQLIAGIIASALLLDFLMLPPLLMWIDRRKNRSTQ